MMDRRKLVCASSSFFALNMAAFGICPPIMETSLPIGPFGFGRRFVAVVSVLLGLQVGVAYAAACLKYFFLIHSPVVRNLCLDAQIHGLRKICLLLVTLAATVTYQAGLSPPGGVWAVTAGEWEHSRYYKGSKVKDQGRRRQMEKILHAGAPAYARHTLKNLFKVIGIPQNVQAAAGASTESSESTSMGSNRDTEPDNTRVAKNNGINAVAETAATWLVASAATHHATGNRSLLSGFKTVDDLLNIQTGDGRRMPVSGRGCVITETLLLPDVCFVPGLNNNIVSISQLIKLGCRVEMNHDACYITGATDGTVIGEAPVGENGMFKLEFLKVPPVI